MDVLRGVAVVGMALVHVLYAVGDVDLRAHPVVNQLLTDKFRLMFTMLFGGSLVLQLQRADSAGIADRSFMVGYVRRLVILWAVFGLGCAAWLQNDVLLSYALFGLVLPLLVRWRTVVVLAVALLCLTVQRLRPVIESRWAAAHPVAAAQQRAARTAERNLDSRRYRHAVAARAHGRLFILTAEKEFRGFSRWRSYVSRLDVLGIMLLGLLAVRSGTLHAPRQHRRAIAAAGLLGLGLWLWANAPDRMLHTGNTIIDLVTDTGLGLRSLHWLGLTYAAGTLIALSTLQKTGRIRRTLLAGTAAIGRMALTWFILHQLVLVALFSHLGWQLPLSLGAWPAVFGVIILAMGMGSVQWLSRARSGPLEWLWRCLADLRLHPLRRSPMAAIPQAQSLAASG